MAAVLIVIGVVVVLLVASSRARRTREAAAAIAAEVERARIVSELTTLLGPPLHRLQGMMIEARSAQRCLKPPRTMTDEEAKNLQDTISKLDDCCSTLEGNMPFMPPPTPIVESAKAAIHEANGLSGELADVLEATEWHRRPEDERARLP
jgi:hypothetical protein